MSKLQYYLSPSPSPLAPSAGDPDVLIPSPPWTLDTQKPGGYRESKQLTFDADTFKGYDAARTLTELKKIKEELDSALDCAHDSAHTVDWKKFLLDDDLDQDLGVVCDDFQDEDESDESQSASDDEQSDEER